MIDVRNSVYVGHLGPIPLYIHWSAFILCYFAWQWAGGGSDFDLRAGIAILAMLIVGIVLHELGHGLAGLLLARREAEKALLIILWALGGLCVQGGRDNRPWKELIIVLAGPAVSLVLWLGCEATFTYLHEHQRQVIVNGRELTVLGLLLGYGAEINKMLLIFNLLPIYPLDGGQATYNLLKMTLRNYDWARTISFAGSVGFAVWWVLSRMQDSGGLNGSVVFSALFMTFLLYNAYLALFVFRR
jgi:Zn-dependent protease